MQRIDIRMVGRLDEHASNGFALPGHADTVLCTVSQMVQRAFRTGEVDKELRIFQTGCQIRCDQHAGSFTGR